MAYPIANQEPIMVVKEPLQRIEEVKQTIMVVKEHNVDDDLIDQTCSDLHMASEISVGDDIKGVGYDAEKAAQVQALTEPILPREGWTDPVDDDVVNKGVSSDLGDKSGVSLEASSSPRHNAVQHLDRSFRLGWRPPPFRTPGSFSSIASLHRFHVVSPRSSRDEPIESVVLIYADSNALDTPPVKPSSIQLNLEVEMDYTTVGARHNKRFTETEHGQECAVVAQGKWQFELLRMNSEDIRETSGAIAGHNISKHLKGGIVVHSAVVKVFHASRFVRSSFTPADHSPSLLPEYTAKCSCSWTTLCTSVGSVVGNIDPKTGFHVRHVNEVDTTGMCNAGLSMVSSLQATKISVGVKMEQRVDDRLQLREGRINQSNDATIRKEKLMVEDFGDSDQSNNSYETWVNSMTSWRISHPKHALIAKSMNSSRNWHKEFASLRDISGHMRCHSVKTKKVVRHLVYPSIEDGLVVTILDTIGRVVEHSQLQEDAWANLQCSLSQYSLPNLEPCLAKIYEHAMTPYRAWPYALLGFWPHVIRTQLLLVVITGSTTQCAANVVDGLSSMVNGRTSSMDQVTKFWVLFDGCDCLLFGIISIVKTVNYYEVAAAMVDLKFNGLTGDIGCFVNDVGLILATTEIIKHNSVIFANSVVIGRTNPSATSWEDMDELLKYFFH